MEQSTVKRILVIQKKYNYTKSLGKSIYVFEMGKTSSKPNVNQNKLDEFKMKVKENRLISLNIDSISELKSKVSQTLFQNVPNEIKEGGWVRIEDCGKNVKKLKKLDAIQRNLDTYYFLKEDLYKIFMRVKTFYFQQPPFDISYIDDIENYLLNFEINLHKSFVKINPYNYNQTRRKTISSFRPF